MQVNISHAWFLNYGLSGDASYQAVVVSRRPDQHAMRLQMPLESIRRARARARAQNFVVYISHAWLRMSGEFHLRRRQPASQPARPGGT
eukprot:COSAG05_NODE_18802_length_302_cov_1.270936_1_plen_88_part_10